MRKLYQTGGFFWEFLEQNGNEKGKEMNKVRRAYLMKRICAVLMKTISKRKNVWLINYSNEEVTFQNCLEKIEVTWVREEGRGRGKKGRKEER